MATTLAEVAQIITTHRLNKAQVFAATLEAKGFTLDQVRSLDSHGWHLVAAAAGRKPAKGKEALSEQTKQLVIAILESRERNTGQDCFRKF